MCHNFAKQREGFVPQPYKVQQRYKNVPNKLITSQIKFNFYALKKPSN